MKKLTKKQSQIHKFITAWQMKKSYPPTQEEIRDHFGFSSQNAVRSHLVLIEKKGYIRLNWGKARGIELIAPADIFLKESSIPLFGDIAAGVPLWAEQNFEDHLPISPTLFGSGALFALKVIGESMIDAGIRNGDFAIIRRQNMVDSGEIAAVLIDQETTLKRVILAKNKLILKSENKSFENLEYSIEENSPIHILGHYLGIVRTKSSRGFS